MVVRFYILTSLMLAALIGLGGKVPGPLHPARPASEAAADFYPEIEKIAELHQRWAARAAGAELDSCRRHYRQAILDAFGHFRNSRRHELLQTRWPRTYVVTCRGKRKELKTCKKVFAAPLGQEYDTVGMRVPGRGLRHIPSPSSNKRHLLVTTTKRGEGVMRTRVFVNTRRTVEDVERVVSNELQGIRIKLERHGLPSDVTLARYEP